MTHLARQRGREEERLPLLRQHADDSTHIVDEAHIEHAIGLVEDEEFNRPQVDELLLHEVEQPPRRGDQHVHALAHRRLLRPLADAAVDHRRLQVSVAAIHAEALVDLAGQLAGGRQHEHTAAAGRPLTRIRHHPLDQRQREGSGLAGACLRAAKEVAAGEHVRHRLRLDRRRHGVALGLQRLEHRFCQSQTFKRRHIQLVFRITQFSFNTSAYGPSIATAAVSAGITGRARGTTKPDKTCPSGRWQKPFSHSWDALNLKACDS